MLNFLFGKDTDNCILNQQSFSGKYQIITKSCFVMGKDNPPIHVSSNAIINLTQIVEKNKIFTRVSFVDMTTETDYNNMKEPLQEAQLFTKINPAIEVCRDEKGKVKNISNWSEMWNDWEQWKEKQLPLVIPDERKQQKIIENYENGLKSLESNFEKNFQYLLLLPECYKFKGYPNPQDTTSGKTYSSRFVEKLDFIYFLSKKSFSDKNNIVKLSLETQLSDSECKRMEKQLIRFYEKNMPDFSHEDYLFDIEVEYTFDKKTSEITNANLFFVERLHSNFSYTIELNLIKIIKKAYSSNIPPSTPPPSSSTPTSPVDQAQNQNKNKRSPLFEEEDNILVI